MRFNDINLQVSGPVQPASIYKTKVLKGQVPFAVQVTEPNTKYVIKHNFDLDGADVTIPANCVLEFDGGSVKGGTITYNNTILSGDYVGNLPTCVGTVGTRTITPQMYGAVADGVTDDAPAIINCIEGLPDSDFKLIFPAGIYIQGNGLNEVPCAFFFQNKKNFSIYGYGATIIANPNNECIVDNRGFEFRYCENGLVCGLTYNGNIEERKPSMGDAGSINNQSAFRAAASPRIHFLDVTSIGAIMDGFNFSYEFNTIDGVRELYYSDYCCIENCLAEYSYRGGLSITGARYGVAKNCVFRYTGRAGYGTSPWFGIDIEDGYYGNLGGRGWTIDSCKIYDNQGSALSLSAGACYTKVVNCFIGGNIFHNDSNSDFENSTSNIIENCHITGSVMSYIGGLSFFNNVFTYSGTGNLFSASKKSNADKEVDIFKGNKIRFVFNPTEEPISGDCLSTKRGAYANRPAEFVDNTFFNFTGLNAVQFFNFERFLNNSFICEYELNSGIYASKFTGNTVIGAKIKKGNTADDKYNFHKGYKNQLESANDGCSVYQPYDVYSVNANKVADIILGKAALFDSKMFLEVIINPLLSYIITINNRTQCVYQKEKGNGSETFSDIYTDANGIAHIIMKTSGIQCPTIVFKGAYGNTPNHIIGNVLELVIRDKTSADDALNYNTPT